MSVNFIPLFLFVLADKVRKIKKYYVMFAYFFIVCLAYLALQTENIVKKITQPKWQKYKKTKLPKWNETIRDVTKTPKVYQSSPPLATLSLPICHPSYRHQREQSRMTNCSEKSWKVFKYFNHPSGKKLCSIIAHCSTNNQHGSHFVFSQIQIWIVRWATYYSPWFNLYIFI